MIVGITAAGPGTTVVEEFQNGASPSQVLDKFVGRYSPPLDPGDFFAFDSGWVGQVVKPSAGMRWAWDHGAGSLVEVAVPYSRVVSLPQYSKAALPPPTIGWMIYVVDDNSGPQPAYSDGVSWLRMNGAPVT